MNIRVVIVPNTNGMKTGARIETVYYERTIDAAGIATMFRKVEGGRLGGVGPEIDEKQYIDMLEECGRELAKWFYSNVPSGAMTAFLEEGARLGLDGFA